MEDYRRFTAAVGAPVLANLTEFGQTPLFTTAELSSAGVAMALYPLSAFRAMSAAPPATSTPRSAPTARSARPSPQMQTASRALSSPRITTAYEAKLDQLFARASRPRERSRLRLPDETKKSVALSGVPAGNTAICTVGQTGNDLHYRGYDIADLAAQARPSRRSPTC